MLGMVQNRTRGRAEEVLISRELECCNLELRTPKAQLQGLQEALSNSSQRNIQRASPVKASRAKAIGLTPKHQLLKDKAPVHSICVLLRYSLELKRYKEHCLNDGENLELSTKTNGGGRDQYSMAGRGLGICHAGLGSCTLPLHSRPAAMRDTEGQLDWGLRHFGLQLIVTLSLWPKGRLFDQSRDRDN